MPSAAPDLEPAEATPRERRKWAQYLADERAEAAVYRRLARRKDGEEREILLELEQAEKRHEQHWLTLLGEEPKRLPPASFTTRVTAFFASRFGSVFALALAQRAEARSPYDDDPYATPAMRADEKVHHEVVRGLAARSRRSFSGTFRAAVFGANDGLVSNLALVLGIGATGVAPQFVLVSGIAGLLAGALSMAAGEFVSVRSQRELLESTRESTYADAGLPDLDIDQNELALVYRTRGMSDDTAQAKARATIRAAHAGRLPTQAVGDNSYEEVGGAWRAAASSFLFFGTGALLPVLPWIFGMSGVTAILAALIVVGLALLLTGATVGLLSGASPLPRALRQLAIGFGAAGVTYVLGMIFGVDMG
ncbi:VIT1/CCC1 transporter family protein [Microbacterium amylolyticum]|uniref:VIT1/CCC1 family predicted Fe2+/Mn2+ transporter n=1 Tax=Microbacterium amylolyticum TaxID=936337 RepID=A0ABS4ZEV2_9MICO|nr:VIT1/CCC1 transporter family protein [Microbacterium amylolyticum]MBP2435822.1 VIT1/CCC1 family predicted Fe2+/Mn2+ transporter [Microbacterium amylolyticum]